MSGPPAEGRVRHACRVLGDVCAFAATVVSALALWTWMAGVADLLTSEPGHVPMAPSTAILMLVAAGVVASRNRWPTRAAATRIGRGAMATVAGAGLLVCARAWLGWGSPLEEWLAQTTETAGDVPLGQMSPLTGVAFVAVALSFLLPRTPYATRRTARGVATAGATALLLLGVAVAASYAARRPWLYGVGVIPMALSTAVAFAALGLALLLSLALPAEPPGPAAPAGAPPSAASGRSAWPPLVTSGVIAVAIAVIGALYLRYGQAVQARAEARHVLTAIADAKAAQIVRWRHERVDDAGFLSRASFVGRDLGALLSRPGARILGPSLAPLVDSEEQYDTVALFDADLTPRLVIPQGTDPASIGASRELIATAVRARRVVVSDLRRDASRRDLYLDIAFPIFDVPPPATAAGAGSPAASGAVPVGAGLLRIDPQRFLLPLVRAWPVPSASGEALLVRRHDGDVVSFSDVRHPEVTLPLHRPADAARPPWSSLTARRPTDDVVEGTDARGVAVVAAVRAVPDSPWWIVAKLDRDEVYAPIRRQAWLTLGLTAAFAVLAAAAGELFWQRREAAFAREERLAERQRFALTERVALLLRQANDAILLMDEEWRILEANPRAAEMYGYTEDELRGLRLLDLRAPHTRAALERLRPSDIVHGTIRENLHQRKDGTTFPVEASLKATVIDGRTYYQDIVRDVTERRRAEEALRLQTAAMESAANAIVLTSRDGRIIWVNAAFSTLTGYTREEALGQTPRLVRSGAHDRAYYEELWRTILDGRVWHGEITNRRKDGTTYLEDMTITPIRDAAGAVTHFVAVKQDVSERRRMQARLVQSEKLAAMGYLLAGVAHEMNNPLAVVIGQTELLRRAGDPRVVERAAKIGAAAARCARIVKNFLALARQREPERQPVQVNTIVLATLELMAYQMRVDDIETVLRLADDLPVVFADPHQLQQVAVNLVTNAYQAMRRAPRPRRLTITTQPSADGVRLDVEDTGPGIAPEVEAHVFEPFFTTKSVGEGTGLGLSLCKSIVEAHGGTIAFEGRPGQGARFTIELPAGPPGPTPAAIVGDPARSIRNLSVLVVDDEPEVRELVAEILGPGTNRIVAVADGLEALAALRRDTFDVVLTDLKMPRLDGIALYQVIVTQYPALSGRVVLMTGDTLGTSTDEFLRTAIAPCIVKPFGPTELIAAIQAVTTSPGGAGH